MPSGTRTGEHATVNDVAALANVSRQTVSNVVNAPERVREQTRQRVQVAIDQLSYRPHRLARNLKARTSLLLGYAVPPATGDGINPVLDRFLHDLTTAAREDGYHVLLFTPEPGQSEAEAHLDLAATHTVDGFVLSETNYDDPRVRALAEQDVPFVAFGRTGIELPHSWVDVDGAAGTAAAVAHLTDRGHARVGFVGWPQGSLTGDERLAGYRRGMADAGLAEDPGLIGRAPNDTVAAAAAAGALLERSDAPTAVLCASDLLAIGVLHEARRRGLGVPDDLAVVGFDDTPVAPITTPALTSVRQPLAGVAREVVRLLTAHLAGAGVPQDGLLLSPQLIVRDTT
jgi:DNA-binding LacI/PurR family transcriptional regulator